MILAAKHVTNSRFIAALCTFKPFISHNRIYWNRRKNFVGCLGCRIMTPIDKTVSSETFGCFRNIFGKFKIYTFFTLVNKLLLTKKFRKKFCMQK